MSLWGRRLVAAGFLLTLTFLGARALQWQPAIDRVLRPGQPPAIEEQATVRLYFADGDAQCLLAETRVVSWTAAARDPRAERSDGTSDFAPLARAALAALAAGPVAEGLWPVIPAGARVLNVELAGSVAAVDYGLELRTNHGGGSAGEMLTVGAIAGTLSELPGVETVQILLGGKRAETLVGHLSLLEPIRIDPGALALGRICWDGIQ